MTKINAENHPTTKYARQLVSGEILCCKAEKLLAKKHLRDLKRQGTKAFPYVFDESRADRFFRLFEMCRNTDTNEYYKILPHQQLEYGMLYGWVHRDTGIRKYKTVYDQKSRGNAKTTGCSIIAINGLIADKLYPPGKEELGYIIPNAVIQLMAVDKKQVDELRDPICEISKASPRISPRIEVKKTLIRGKKYGGKIIVLSKDSDNQQGGKPNLLIIDEFSSHRSSKRSEDARKGIGKKAQGLVYIITTAGDNEETNPAKREYDYAKKVLSGEIIDESYLPIIRETEPGDDIHDPRIWSKSTPMFRYRGKYSYSDTLFETVEREHKRAFESNDPDLQRHFKIYRLNTWQERSTKSYLTAEQMRQLDSLAVSPNEFNNLVHGRTKIKGLDFSVRRDLTADGDVFLLPDGRLAIDAHGFMLKECIREREISDKVPYSEWEKQGWLTTMAYPAMNKRFVAKDFICRSEAMHQEIKETCYDVFKAKDLIMDLIDGEYGGGFDEKNCIQIPQRVQHLHIPTTLLRDSIVTGNLVWNGNPLLRWCLANCIEFKSTHGELIKVMKENPDSPRRIDLAAAVINALARIDSLKSDSWVERMASMTDGFF